METSEPEMRKGGCLTPVLVILIILGCMAYLAISGEERLPLGCGASPSAPRCP